MGILNFIIKHSLKTISAILSGKKCEAHRLATTAELPQEYEGDDFKIIGNKLYFKCTTSDEKWTIEVDSEKCLVKERQSSDSHMMTYTSIFQYRVLNKKIQLRLFHRHSHQWDDPDSEPSVIDGTINEAYFRKESSKMHNLGPEYHPELVLKLKQKIEWVSSDDGNLSNLVGFINKDQIDILEFRKLLRTKEQQLLLLVDITTDLLVPIGLQLTEDDRGFDILTCENPGIESPEVKKSLDKVFVEIKQKTGFTFDAIRNQKKELTRLRFWLALFSNLPN